MIQFKVCLLGAPGVGKTSLATRFVHGGFSENYHSTIGVKIDKKVVEVAGGSVQLIVWDVQGEERYAKVLPAYLSGMAGYLLVVDGTRPETTATAARLQASVAALASAPPFVLLRNKSDLADRAADETAGLMAVARATFGTSARTGEAVDEAFATLANALVDAGTDRPRP